jgi:nucleoside-diphosphate-sugar epimerase
VTARRARTVLVTGAAGFIGSRLVARLRQDETTRVVILTRSEAAAAIPGVTTVRASLERLTPRHWQEQGVGAFDVVFHLGGFIPKSAADGDRVAEVYRDNLLGTRALLESLVEPPGRVVFASTVDVYAPPADGRPLDESSPLGPENLYGASKLFCERLVRAHCRRSGSAHALLRYGHIFGPGEERCGKLIPATIRALLRGEPVALHGDGLAERDYLFVDDAVEATLRAAASSSAELGPINVARGASVTIREVAALLLRLVGRGGSVDYLPDRPRGRSYRIDAGAMFAEFGRWPLTALEDGLRIEVEHLRGLPDERT